MMKYLRRVLEPRKNNGACFVTYDCDGHPTSAVGCWLELYYQFVSDDERWIYEAKYGAGSAVDGALRLTLLQSRQEGYLVRVAIRPEDARERYGTDDVRLVAAMVDADFQRLLLR